MHVVSTKKWYTCSKYLRGTRRHKHCTTRPFIFTRRRNGCIDRQAKVNLSLTTPWRSKGKQRYSSTYSWSRGYKR